MFTIFLILCLLVVSVSILAGYNFKKRKEEAEAYAEELQKKLRTIAAFNQELRARYADIERLNQLFIGRELEMVKLKEDISRLKGD